MGIKMDLTQTKFFHMLESKKIKNRTYSKISWLKFFQYKLNITIPYITEIILYYAWIPVICYIGMNMGTHKYFIEDDTIVQKERIPKFTDCIPFIGTFGKK